MNKTVKILAFVKLRQNNQRSWTHEVCILVEREKQQIKKSADIMLENDNTMGESDREEVKDAGDEGCHFQ